MYCRRCGATLHQGVVICPECGARQRRGLSAVRCARCGDRVPLGLTVCPNCGRDVHAAGPRWGLWLTGFAGVALAVLWGLGELPVDSILSEVASVRTRVAGVVQVLGPAVSDLDELGEFTVTPQVVAEVGETPMPTPTLEEAAAPLLDDELSTPVDLPSPEDGLRSSPEPTEPVLETPVSESTAMPTPTPTASATASPTAMPTGAPTQPPASTGQITYKVKSGDSLSSIAAQFGIAWQDLAAANGLTSRSTLRIGQELVVPGKGGTSPVAPTAAPAPPRPTQSPVPPSPTPVQLLPAPQLKSPADQTPFTGENSFIELVWSAVDGLPSGAQYQVSIRWTEQGAPMEYTELRTTATSIRMPLWLFGKADQPSRQYAWSVRVVQVTTDGQGGQKDILLSPSSATRSLAWF